MDVSIQELRDAANLLFDYLIEANHQKVYLPHDYYWSVTKEAKYDPHKEPNSHSLGQLSDDLCELKAFLKGENEPLAYGLVWLASLLSAVGEEIVR